MQTDPNGLIYMRGQFYSPAWHRFINSDQGADPNQANQFAYCGGSPMMTTDPSGMKIFIPGQYHNVPMGQYGGNLDENLFGSANNMDGISKQMTQTNNIYLNNGQIVTNSAPLPMFPSMTGKQAALKLMDAYSFDLGLLGLFAGMGGVSPNVGFALACSGTAIAGTQLVLEPSPANLLGLVGSGSRFAPGMVPAVFGATFGTALGSSSSQDCSKNPNGPGRG